MEEEIIFKGHQNIKSTHKTTIEVTKDAHLTPRGDCIIGVNANKGCDDLSDQFKNRLKDDNVIKISIIVDNYEYSFNAFGSKQLILSNKHDIVIRKSNFVCNRTLCIKSQKASIDIPRDIIQLLKEGRRGMLLLYIE